MIQIPIEGCLVSTFDDWDASGGAAVFCPDCAGYIRFLADHPQGDEPIIELAINSEGGDTYGADLIASAVHYYAGKWGKVEILIEGLAASAAANLVLKCKDVARIKMRVGAQLMFHSCMSCVFGGAAAMRDAADGIDGYNAGIRELLSKYTDLPADTVDEWLAEGRMGWLTAQEALECGLVDETIGGIREELAGIDESVGGKVAAFRRGVRVAYLSRLANMGPAQEAAMAEEKKVTEKVEEKQVDPAVEEVVEEIVEEKKEEEEKKPTIEEVLKEMEVLKERVAACERERDEEKAKVAALSAGFKATAPAPAVGMRWPDLVRKACEGKVGRAWDEAFCALKAQYPQEYNDYTNSKKNYTHID